MEVEEGRFRDGERFWDFVVYGQSKPELFAARLRETSKKLQILWTESARPARLLVWCRQVQTLAGGPGSFTEIEGQATEKLRTLIKTGRFDVAFAAAILGESLGGKWRVTVVLRPNSAPRTWDVVAIRIGD